MGRCPALEHNLLLLKRLDENDVVARIRHYIRRNFQMDVSLKSIAEHVHLSPSYVSRVFHRETGETVTAYLNRVRVSEAKRLLRITNMRVSEVCYEVGYQSLSHFTRMFKRVTGLSPRAFRASSVVSGP